MSVGSISSWQMDSYGQESLQRRLWATSGATVGICSIQGTGKDVGELLGTAFVARDMAQVAEALDKDGLIRYWGFSYGSLLGQTLAALFPERIDRLIIDGVLNYHEWYNDLASVPLPPSPWLHR